jgi:hypothetical protein
MGCVLDPPQFCPDLTVRRDEMAVFLLRGMNGANFTPPPATGMMFDDVPRTHPFAGFIEELADDRITSGCSASPPLYCPAGNTTRGHMAAFLLKAKHGPTFVPPPATGTMFVDVPITHPLVRWIEQLAREGITGGCGGSPPRFCPNGTVTRGQMAVFLARAFGLLF